jgi:(p)ppGpp synthase/HD superfamily hydrolase
VANEQKSQRFERLAERRVAETIKKLRLIGNLANRSNYEYSAEHVKQMFLAMEREMKAAKDRFALSTANSLGFSFQKKNQDNN